MKAITIREPWAWLIAKGIKDIENRTWPTKYRGRVLIHASKKCEKEGWNALSDEQRSLLVGTEAYSLSPSELPYGSIIGSVEIVDCVIDHPSAWAEKSIEGQHEIYNWVLRHPVMFPEAIPAKGKLGLWAFPDIGAEPEEEGGKLFCQCHLPVKLENRITSFSYSNEYRCCYCDGIWYR